MAVYFLDGLGDARRKSPRIGTDIVAKLIPLKKNFKIKLEVIDDNTVLEGIVTDVSKGGIGFIVEGSIVIDDIVDTRIIFDEITVSCTVSIKHSLIIGDVSCVGAKFIDINPEGKDYIDRIVDLAMERYIYDWFCYMYLCFFQELEVFLEFFFLCFCKYYR